MRHGMATAAARGGGEQVIVLTRYTYVLAQYTDSFVDPPV